MTRNQAIFTSIGTALGLSLATYIGFLIQYAGKGAILTMLIGFALGTCYALPYWVVSRKIVLAGGQYGLAAAGISPVFSCVINYVTMMALLIYASNPLALSTYIVSLYPPLAPYSKWIALASALLCFVIVIAKVTGMGKAQSFFTVALLIGMVAYVVFGFVHIAKAGTGDGLGFFDFSQDPIWAENGFGGVLSGIPFCAGMMGMYSAMLYYGPLVEKPKKNVPLAMRWGMIATGVIWFFAVLVTANVLPVSQVAGQPLTVVAEAVMPMALAKAFVVLGPIMAILTTYVGNMPGSLEAAKKMADEGWLPKFMGRTNKDGRPWVAALIFVFFPMVLVLFDIPLTTVQNMVNLASSPSMILLAVALFRLPHTAPEVFDDARFNLLLRIAALLSFGFGCFNFVLSARNTNIATALIVAAIVVALYLFCEYRRKQGKIAQVPISTYLRSDEEQPAAPAQEKA